MSRASNWANSDGLRVSFGLHTSDNAMFREVAGQGAHRIIQGYIVYASLADTASATSYPYHPAEAVVPRGAVCLRGSMQSIVAALTSNAATYDIGMWSRGLSTEVVDSTDALVADITTAELTPIGEAHILNGTMIVAAGSSTAITVGSVSNSNCVIAPSWEESVPTGGTGLLTFEFLCPWGPAGAVIAV